MPRRPHSGAGELNRALDSALAHGDLGLALGAAKDLPAVGLDRAAKLLFLLARNKDRRYPKAAARWLSRYAAETRDLTPAMLSDAADALAELQAGDFDAAERLLAAVRGAR